MKVKIVLLFCIALSFSACSDQKEVTRKAYASAMSSFYANRFEQANTLFSQCIDAGFNTSECYFYRGSGKFNLKDYNGAIADLSAAIKLDSVFADAYCTRGDILTFLGRKDEGCRDWHKAQDLGKPNMRDKVKYCF